MTRTRLFPLLSAVALAVAIAWSPAARAQGQGMTAAADPRAVEAGNQMLARGGSATDAAIAAMAVLGLVEPQSAGLGGGAFLMHYEAKRKRVSAFDGRETAPAGATPDMFMGPDGKPMNFRDAVVSGRSAGAPALIPMLKLAHDKHGKLPWRVLFEPAIKHAEEGFTVSSRLNRFIGFANSRGGLGSEAAKRYLLDAKGQPWPAGAVIKNPEYAATLRLIARQGPKALQTGPIAQAIVEAVAAEPRAGTLSLSDLRNYKPRELTPVCGAYRAKRVCGMAPPSSGGISVLTILGLYERARPKPEGAASVDDWAAFAWASRLAYADRDYYVADDTFVPVPTYGLVAPQYWDARVAAIDVAKAPPARVEPGDPMAVVGGESLKDRWGRETPDTSTGTTHLSVVDAAGNAVALTATVESIFGNQRMAGGFFLNNELTDFSLAPTLNGKPVANAVAPGKRPRSSMAPSVVLNEDGSLYAVAGSPGGSAIIAYAARTIIAMIDWGMTPQQAVDAGHVIARAPAVRIESERMPKAIMDGLTQRGWTLQPTNLEQSGLHVIRVTAQGLEGGADPRREGAAILAPAPARTR